MTGAEPANQTPRLRVLVLEDEMMVAMLLEEMLREIGCEVIGPANSAPDALTKLREQLPDIALLDVNLSFGQSGYPVAEALSAAGVPFAFVTGYGAGTLKPEFRDRPTLQKPFHLSSLTQVVQQLGSWRSAPAPAPSGWDQKARAIP